MKNLRLPRSTRRKPPLSRTLATAQRTRNRNRPRPRKPLLNPTLPTLILSLSRTPSLSLPPKKLNLLRRNHQKAKAMKRRSLLRLLKRSPHPQRRSLHLQTRRQTAKVTRRIQRNPRLRQRRQSLRVTNRPTPIQMLRWATTLLNHL